MDFKNLAENKGKLISYLQDNHYCADYIHWFECEINWILQESAMNEYATYEDIYRDRISRRPYSKSTQDMKKQLSEQSSNLICMENIQTAVVDTVC